MAGLFGKEHKRGVLKGIEGRAGGSAQKCLLPPLSTGKQRRGAQGRRCEAREGASGCS